MKPRLLYITDLLVPYRIDWMNELAAYFDITCFHFNKTDETREKSWLTRQKKSFKTSLLTEKHLFFFRYSTECFKKVKESDYDFYIIDGYNSFIQYNLIRKLAKHGSNVYVNVDGIDVWKKETLIQKLKNKLKKKIYCSGAKFLCGSHIAARHIVKNGARPEDVFTHPFTSLFKNEICTFEEKNNKQKQFKKEMGLSEYKVVTAVGRFIKLKRYEDLLLAWKNVPNNAFLILIGGGELKNDYLSLINKLGIKNVKIYDFLEKEKLNKMYYISDLFVHPSETETWGLVINEAMAKGCPCIATKHCVAGAELIKNGINGYLIDAGDINSLSLKIAEIVENDQKRVKMSKNSLITISRYTIENLAIEHKNILLSNK